MHAKNTVESRNARCWCASCSRGKKEERQGSVQILLFAAWEQITQKIPGNNEKKKRYLGNENYRGLYWRDPTSCPKEKMPGSPRTFSTVLYPRTSSLRAKQDHTTPVPFLSPFRLLLCFVPIESKAKRKWAYEPLYLLDERERTLFPGLWIGFSHRHSFLLIMS